MLNEYDLFLYGACKTHDPTAVSFGDFKVENCDFGSKDFDGLVFVKAVFENCNLSDTSFRNCSFDECVFMDCDLEGTNFESCEMSEVCIHDCQMEGSVFDLSDIHKISLSNTSGRISFEGTDFSAGCGFYYCDLVEANFRGASFEKGCMFITCDLNRAVFDTSTLLDEVYFYECNLTDSHVFMASNGPSCELDSCFVLPLSRPVPYNKTAPTINKVPITRISVENTSFHNRSYEAHLYCANLEEYKAIK